MKPVLPLLLFILIPVSGCIERFYPDIKDYENMLVVEGSITQEHKPYQFYLSHSFPFDDYRAEKESGAIVEIEDNDGNKFPCHEKKKGLYESSPDEFTGRAGKSYRLHITTRDGLHYASDWVTMRSTPEIDSVFYEYREGDLRADYTRLQGIQIYVNTHDPSNKTFYYRWRYTETWEFHVPYTSLVKPNADVCWRTDSSRNIYIASTIGLSSNLLKRQPVVFIDNSSNRLAIAYSILIRQYSLNDQGYQFYKTLVDNNQATGTLFDTPPSQAAGNIYCTTDNRIPVFGFFDASEVKTHRLSVKRENLPGSFYTTNGYDFCRLVEIPEQDKEQLNLYYRQGYQYYLRYFNSQLDKWMVILVSEANCIDCTIDGTNVKPSFWPY